MACDDELIDLDDMMDCGDDGGITCSSCAYMCYVELLVFILLSWCQLRHHSKAHNGNKEASLPHSSF